MIFLEGEDSVRVSNVWQGVGPTRRNTNTVVVELATEDVLMLIHRLAEETAGRDPQATRTLLIIEKDRIDFPMEVFE